MYGIPLIVPRGSQPEWFDDEDRGRGGRNRSDTVTLADSTAIDEAEREHESKMNAIRDFGGTWIRPPGLAMTLFTVLDDDDDDDDDDNHHDTDSEDEEDEEDSEVYRELDRETERAAANRRYDSEGNSYTLFSTSEGASDDESEDGTDEDGGAGDGEEDLDADVRAPERTPSIEYTYDDEDSDW